MFELLKKVEFLDDFGKMPMNLSRKHLGAILHKTKGIDWQKYKCLNSDMEGLGWQFSYDGNQFLAKVNNLHPKYMDF